VNPTEAGTYSSHRGLPDNAERDQREEQRWQAHAGEPVEAHSPLRVVREQRGLHRAYQNPDGDTEVCDYEDPVEEVRYEICGRLKLTVNCMAKHASSAVRLIPIRSLKFSMGITKTVQEIRKISITGVNTVDM
jgi:hypothetical protein